MVEKLPAVENPSASNRLRLRDPESEPEVLSSRRFIEFLGYCPHDLLASRLRAASEAGGSRKSALPN